MNLVPFEVGKPLWSDSDRYFWKEVSKGFEGFVFTQFDDHYKGITRFEVQSKGRVFLAVTSRWGGGGNGSGGWMEELTTKRQFLKQGWLPVVQLHETGDDYGHEHQWVLYTRECQAGEALQIKDREILQAIAFLPGLKSDQYQSTTMLRYSRG